MDAWSNDLLRYKGSRSRKGNVTRLSAKVGRYTELTSHTLVATVLYIQEKMPKGIGTAPG